VRCFFTRSGRNPYAEGAVKESPSSGKALEVFYRVKLKKLRQRNKNGIYSKSSRNELTSKAYNTSQKKEYMYF